MRLLLDTHVFVWALLEPHRLREEANSALTDPDNELFVSSLAAWEVYTKVQKPSFAYLMPLVANGTPSFTKSLSILGASQLDITLESLVAGAQLPLWHKDPFDRILLGQAATAGLTLVTHDKAMLRYSGIPFIKA